MKTKPATVLLVVIAVLLAANLIPATAQSPPPFNPPDSEPTVVGITALAVATGGSGTIRYVYRIWSDGMVEENRRVFNTIICPGSGGVSGPGGWCGWTTVPE